jgi:hypothetical protein
MAAEKIVGCAPRAKSNSAMSRLPTCDAAPSAVSQSPKPQSHVAFARENLIPHQFLDPGEVAVGDDDRFLHQFGRLGWKQCRDV